MKRYIKRCEYCGNTFETDNNRQDICNFCNKERTAYWNKKKNEIEELASDISLNAEKK